MYFSMKSTVRPLCFCLSAVITAVLRWMVYSGKAACSLLSSRNSLEPGDAGALGVILGDGDGLLVVVDDVAVVLLLVSHSVPFFLPFGISRIS